MTRHLRSYLMLRTQMNRHRIPSLTKNPYDKRRSSRGDSNPQDGDRPNLKFIMTKLIEGGGIAFGSVLVVGLAGYAYHVYYKSMVLRKMESAFAAGYSSPELAAISRHQTVSDQPQAELDDPNWIPRVEQASIDEIVDGTAKGHYYLLTGEKGTGKATMLHAAMHKIDGDGVAMFEAHGDLEIFRLRLGKALNFDYHEDYIGGLFSFKGPRDTTPLLDIERAFNKMEKIALARQQTQGKPLVVIINGIHLLRNNEEGQHLLDLVQQRAELWAASNLVTVILNSDEYWITERLISRATRLQVIPSRDISKDVAMVALKDWRLKTMGEQVPSEVLEQVYSLVGGRLRFLDHVARSPDMLRACRAIVEKEKKWFLAQCWIFGGDIDDHAEDQQDECAGAIILAKTLVEQEDALARAGKQSWELPEIPLHIARQIETRPDLVQMHDHKNILTIDTNSMVKADSVAMQNVFREICRQEGFQEHLQATLGRLDELESLGRTREVVMKKK